MNTNCRRFSLDQVEKCQIWAVFAVIMENFQKKASAREKLPLISFIRNSSPTTFRRYFPIGVLFRKPPQSTSRQQKTLFNNFKVLWKRFRHSLASEGFLQHFQDRKQKFRFQKCCKKPDEDNKCRIFAQNFEFIYIIQIFTQFFVTQNLT